MSDRTEQPALTLRREPNRRFGVGVYIGDEDVTNHVRAVSFTVDGDSAASITLEVYGAFVEAVEPGVIFRSGPRVLGFRLPPQRDGAKP